MARLDLGHERARMTEPLDELDEIELQLPHDGVLCHSKDGWAQPLPARCRKAHCQYLGSRAMLLHTRYCQWPRAAGWK